jgi:signal transduction histidine kinase
VTPVLSDVRIGDLVRDLVDETRPFSVSRRIRVDTSDNADSTIRAHPELLRIALRNVIANSIAYAPVGGLVEIDVAEEHDGVAIRISNVAPLLRSSDMDQLFEPLWRKDQSRTDTDHLGLGLSITRAALQSIGMRIHAELSADGVLSMCIRGTREVQVHA